MRKKVKTIVYFCLLLVALFPQSVYAEMPNLNNPLILVPGTGAGANRFDRLLSSMGVCSNHALKIRVDKDGEIHETGRYDHSNPIIVISFEKPGEYNLEEQGEWYAAAIRFASEKYSFDIYDFYGHSNGGLVALEYLEYQRNVNDPEMDQLVSVGTPFNDIYETSDIDVQNLTECEKLYHDDTSEIFKRYYRGREKIPENLKVLMVYGNIRGNGDSVVSVETAQAGVEIFGTRLVDSIEIDGLCAQHSRLVQNPNVINTLKDFLTA